jgi:hypothetical protein
MSAKKRPAYESPKARDLSIFGVNGQVIPQGMCFDGSALHFVTCSPVGNAPGSSGACVPGTAVTNVNSCSPTGVSPQYGYCKTGNGAVEGCISGGVHF